MLYCPLSIETWESLEIDMIVDTYTGETHSIHLNRPRHGCLGLIPVYETLEDLRAVHPDVDYFTVEKRLPQEHVIN